MRPTKVMKHRRIKKEWRRFQVAGTIFFALVMILVLIAGLAVNSQGLYEAAAKEADQTVYITVTPRERDNVPTLLQPTGTTPVVTEDKPETLYYDVPLSEELQDYIFTITEAYGVPCDVVIAIIRQETNYRANATGAAGEKGYMQIHPVNFEWLIEDLGVTDFYDPEQNILCGVYMLSRLYEKYDTTAEVLMCYNCGETGAKRLWAQGYTSTEYTRSIAAHIEALKFIGGKEQ